MQESDNTAKKPIQIMIEIDIRVHLILKTTHLCYTLPSFGVCRKQFEKLILKHDILANTSGPHGNLHRQLDQTLKNTGLEGVLEGTATESSECCPGVHVRLLLLTDPPVNWMSPKAVPWR